MSARVLIVEDNPTNLDLLTYLLEMLGYDVTGSANGAEALDLARAGGFDVVLADILMPGMDGYEFARRFKADPGLATTPLVAVTALAMSGDRERIIASGFDDYISKPIEPRKIDGRIKAVLAKGTSG